MNLFKELFGNMENLLNVFLTFDYSKLLLSFLFISVIYLIHFAFVTFKYKRILEKTFIEIKKINIEATLVNKRKHWLRVYFIIFLFVSFLVISKDNLNLVLPLLSALAVISILSLKEQLNNIFLGVLFKSTISTTIYEGMMFYFRDKPNEVCKICKVNLFKTIYKNDRTGRLHSIENKFLNESNILHKVLRSLDYVEYKYIIKSDYDIEKYIEINKMLLEKYILSINEDYNKDLKENIFDLKFKFNSAPYLKPFYTINLEYKNKDEIQILIELTTYNYDYDNYLEDYLKYKPKI